MAGMAASMSLFRKNIDGADSSVVKFDRTTQDVGRNIDKLSGRLGLLVDVAATLGPALIPIGATAVPALAGLTNQLGFAVLAGGSAILAFQGVGDALKAVNQAQLEPTTANLEKMHEALATLGPAGRDFVMELQKMRPVIQDLQDSAQAGMFPGMTRGIEELSTRLPQVERIISNISLASGQLAEKGGKALAGPEWDDFFNMLETEGRPTLMALGEGIGELTRGLAELWIAFTPLNRDFSDGFLKMSQDFAQWADGLSGTQGFQEFVDYLRTTGPQVADSLGALGNAILQIGEAVAPLGGPALRVIEAFSDAIASIADSDLGTPIFGAIAAWRAYSVAVSLASRAQMGFNRTQAAGIGGGVMAGKAASAKGWASTMKADLNTVATTWATAGARSEREATKMKGATDRLKTSLGGVGKGAAGIAALGVAASGAADGIGLTNTASLALAGTFIGGPLGTGIGAAAGAFLDLQNAGDGLEDTITAVNAAAASSDWSALTSQLASAKKQIDDIQKSDGSWADLITDNIKGSAATLQGRGFTKNQIASSYKKDLKPAADARAEAGAAEAMRRSAAAAQLAAQGYVLVGDAAGSAGQSLAQFKASVDSLTAGLARQAGLDAYKTSLLDFADSLKENGRTLDDNTRKGLANRANLRGIASSAITAAEGMKQFSNRTRFLQGARKDFIGAAVAAGSTRAAARALADQFGLVDRIHAKPKITEQGSAQAKARIASMQAEIKKLRDKKVGISQRGAEAASARIAALKRSIDALRNKSVTITQTQVFNVVRNRAGGRTIAADGDTVPKTGLSYADRHPYLLADGEEVTSNRYGQADRYRPVLKAINADLPSHMIRAMLADGGTAGRLANGGTARSSVDWGDLTLRQKFNRLSAAVDKSTKAVNRETKVRDAIAAKRSELRSAVTDSFKSDIFGGSNVWAAGGGAGGVTGILKADIAKAKTFKSLLANLRKRGLDGDALAALAATGDVGKAQAFASMSNADLRSYESLYNQRSSAANAAGAYAGSAAYGAQQAVANRHLRASLIELRRQNAALKRVEKAIHDQAKRFGHEINHGASKSKRRHR